MTEGPRSTTTVAKEGDDDADDGEDGKDDPVQEGPLEEEGKKELAEDGKAPESNEKTPDQIAKEQALAEHRRV